MTWALIGLGAALVVMISVYIVSLREIRGLKQHMLLILLYDQVYQSQRKSLLEFIHTTQADNAYDLYNKTSNATSNLILTRKESIDGTARALWVAKVTAEERQKA